MYVFQLFDYYAASGMCLLFMSIFETVCIAWVYGKSICPNPWQTFLFSYNFSGAAWREMSLLCFSRCRSLLWQHWRHDWLPPRTLHQVLLVVLHPSHMHCEHQQTNLIVSRLSENDNGWQKNLLLLQKSKAVGSSPIVTLVYLSLQGTFAFSLIKYTPLKYNNEYVYPWWGYAIGWLLALSSMICIPLWMVYKISTTQGTLREVSVAPYGAVLSVILKCIYFV